MSGTNVVFYIWYGSWSTTQQTILRDFAKTLGGSSYFGINSTYVGFNGPTSSSLLFGGETSDNYSKGKSLDTTKVRKIVRNKLITGRLPALLNGIYLVLGSHDTQEDGLCSGTSNEHMGWHTHFDVGPVSIKYGFIGNPELCPSHWWPVDPVGANGSFAADGMASVIAHELDETVTDPSVSAWYSQLGSSNQCENADACAWDFGPNQYTAPNGARANVHLGTRDFLIQQNWVFGTPGHCAMAHPEPITNNSICCDQLLAALLPATTATASPLTGSSPSGGTSSYTYLWRSSTDKVTWSNVPGGSGAGLAPGPIGHTTYYQRLVNASGTTGTSSSNILKLELASDISAPYPFTVSAVSAQAYLFNGGGPNATLPLVRGRAYRFQIHAPGHPFHITTVPGLPPQDFADSALFENGTDTGVITFTVPATVPDTLYYESSADAAMVGTITFSSTPVPTVGQKGVVVLGALMMGGGLMGLRRRRALKAIDGRRSPRSEQKS